MKPTFRLLAYVLVCYVLLSLESPLLTSFHVRMYAPDPALAAVAFAAATWELIPGLLMCALLGLVKDGFSGGVPVGMYSEIYVISFLACFVLARRLDYRNVVLFTLVVTAASLLSSMLFFVLSAIFDRDFEQFDLVFRLCLPQALLTGSFGPLVAAVLSFLDKKAFGAQREGLFR